MHPAALPSGLEDLGDGRLDALVAVADDQLDTAQAPPVQAAQELGPERLGLGVPDLQAEHLALAVGIDAHRHYHRHADDPSSLACLDVGRVDPQVRPVALDRSVQERADALVEFAAQPRHLALGHPAHAERLDQVVDRAGGDALHIGLLHHGGERLLGHPARLRKSGK